MDDKAKITRYAERLTEFMKVSKVCNYTDGCFAKKYKSNLFGGNDEVDIDDTSYSVVLSDGASLYFGRLFNTGLLIDTDGPNKGKNASSDDIFSFAIDEKHFNFDLDYYVSDELVGTPINDFEEFFLFYSLEWIVRNGNMDYLKVGSDGKCPDGKTVLTWDQQTSCK